MSRQECKPAKLLPGLGLGVFLAVSSLSPAVAEVPPTTTQGSPTWERTIAAKPNLEFPSLGSPTNYLPVENTSRLVVSLSKRRVYVYDQEQLISSYPIAVGRSGWETPVGSYHVFLKEVNPIFKSFKSGRIIPAGPDNPLGVRWVGFWTDGKTQLGFHGTNQPELIGQAVSHGCIRMHNKDVVAMYEQVAIGTPVIVQK